MKFILKIKTILWGFIIFLKKFIHFFAFEESLIIWFWKSQEYLPKELPQNLKKNQLEWTGGYDDDDETGRFGAWQLKNKTKQNKKNTAP